MTMQLRDIVPAYEPAPANYREPVVEMEIGGPHSKFKGDPGQLLGFMSKVNELSRESQDRQREEQAAGDISQVDPVKFRKTVQDRLGGDWRNHDVTAKARALFGQRLEGLRQHVFQGKVPRKFTPDQQNFFSGEASKLWRACLLDADAERGRMKDNEEFAMSELDRRIAAHNVRLQRAAKERKAGIDLRKIYTARSIKEYRRSGDLAALRKERKPLSSEDVVRAQKYIDERMEDFAPNLEKDEHENFLIGGKVATSEQLDTLRRAERERLEQKIHGPRLSDVVNGRPAAEADIISIFPEKKKTKDTGEEEIVGEVEGGGAIIRKPDGTFRLGKKPEVVTKKAPAKKEETKKAAKPFERLTVREFLKEMASESGEEEVREFTNSLSKKYGNTRLVDEKFLKQLKKAGQEAKMVGGFLEDWYVDRWIRLGEKVLNLPVPGTRK